MTAPTSWLNILLSDWLFTFPCSKPKKLIRSGLLPNPILHSVALKKRHHDHLRNRMNVNNLPPRMDFFVPSCQSSVSFHNWNCKWFLQLGWVLIYLSHCIGRLSRLKMREVAWVFKWAAKRVDCTCTHK